MHRRSDNKLVLWPAEHDDDVVEEQISISINCRRWKASHIKSYIATRDFINQSITIHWCWAAVFVQGFQINNSISNLIPIVSQCPRENSCPAFCTRNVKMFQPLLNSDTYNFFKSIYRTRYSTRTEHWMVDRISRVIINLINFFQRRSKKDIGFECAIQLLFFYPKWWNWHEK